MFEGEGKQKIVAVDKYDEQTKAEALFTVVKAESLKLALYANVDEYIHENDLETIKTYENVRKVESTRLSLDRQSVILVEGRTYLAEVELYDKDQHKIHITENLFFEHFFLNDELAS